MVTLQSNSKTVTRWVDKLRLPDDELKAIGTLLSVLMQLPRSDVALPAVAAAVWVVVGVECDDVHLHARQLCEAGLAIGAYMRPIPRVRQHVSGEVRPHHKPCRTNPALVGLDVLVYLHVRDVVCPAAELGATLLTLDELLVRVYAPMCAKVTSLTEPLTAHITRVPPLSAVDSGDVRRQTAALSEPLTALGTTVWSLACVGRSMALHVAALVCVVLTDTAFIPALSTNTAVAVLDVRIHAVLA